LYKIVRRPPCWKSTARLARHARLDLLDWLDWLDKVERVESSLVESSRAKWNLSLNKQMSFALTALTCVNAQCIRHQIPIVMLIGRLFSESQCLFVCSVVNCRKKRYVNLNCASSCLLCIAVGLQLFMLIRPI